MMLNATEVAVFFLFLSVSSKRHIFLILITAIGEKLLLSHSCRLIPYNQYSSPNPVSSLNMRLCQHKWEGSCFLGEILCCTGNCAFCVCRSDNGHLFVIIIGRQRKCDRLRLSLITFIITIRRTSANTSAAYHRRWHRNQRNSCCLDYQAKGSCLRCRCAKGCITRESYAWKTCGKVSAYSLSYEKEMVFCVHNTSLNLLSVRLENNWLSEFFLFIHTVSPQSHPALSLYILHTQICHISPERTRRETADLNCADLSNSCSVLFSKN